MAPYGVKFLEKSLGDALARPRVRALSLSLSLVWRLLAHSCGSLSLETTSVSTFTFRSFPPNLDFEKLDRRAVVDGRAAIKLQSFSLGRGRSLVRGGRAAVVVVVVVVGRDGRALGVGAALRDQFQPATRISLSSIS